jgi:hypothetical protein
VRTAEANGFVSLVNLLSGGKKLQQAQGIDNGKIA